jgi:hypothetical protein
VSERFVALRLDLFNAPRQVMRPLNVIWTPTILFADRKLVVHYRSLNFLPPRHFLTLLDIGEAEIDLRWSRTEHAISLLSRAYERDPKGPLAPEALYRRGIAVYLLTHSNAAMYAVWGELLRSFPDSIWAQRVP